MVTLNRNWVVNMTEVCTQGEENNTEEYKTSAISGKINLDMKTLKIEEENYVPMPNYYSIVFYSFEQKSFLRLEMNSK